MQVGQKISIEGDSTPREVVYVTSPQRVIVKYDGGTLVLCNLTVDGNYFDCSSAPASPEEEEFIKANMPDVDTTSVIVTKDPS